MTTDDAAGDLIMRTMKGNGKFPFVVSIHHTKYWLVVISDRLLLSLSLVIN